MSSIKSVFGANIKYYRKKQRISQEQLAERLEITPKHLSNIETGANFVSADLLEKFTQHLGVSASTLFYSVDEISSDDSLLNKIDQMIDDECSKISRTLKINIRHIHTHNGLE